MIETYEELVKRAHQGQWTFDELLRWYCETKAELAIVVKALGNMGCEYRWRGANYVHDDACTRCEALRKIGGVE